MNKAVSISQSNCAILLIGSPSLDHLDQLSEQIHQSSRLFIAGKLPESASREDLPKNIKHLGVEPSNIFKEIEKISFRGLRHITFLTHGRLFSLRRIARDLQNAFATHFESYWKNSPTLMVIGERWTRNITQNLKQICEFQGVMKADSPRIKNQKGILLCGAGPSLETSIPNMKQDRAMYFIITVDTALPILMHHRITPDAVLILEAQAWNVQDFIPLTPAEKNQLKSLPVFADLTSYPPALRLFDPQNITWFMSRFTNSVLVKQLETRLPWLIPVPALGNVSTLGLYIASTLISESCETTIYISGIDFLNSHPPAFTRGSIHHCYRINNHYRLHPLELPPSSEDSSPIQRRDHEVFISLSRKIDSPVEVLSSNRNWIQLKASNEPPECSPEQFHRHHPKPVSPEVVLRSITMFQEQLQRDLQYIEELLLAKNFDMVQQLLEEPLDWLLFPLPAIWSFEKITSHHKWLQRTVATYKQALM